MNGWLLDTNILSELRRPKPERKVLAFVAAQPLDLLYASSATFAEIRFGIELVTDANRRAELNDWLTHRVRKFEQRVLAISEDVMFKNGGSWSGKAARLDIPSRNPMNLLRIDGHL